MRDELFFIGADFRIPRNCGFYGEILTLFILLGGDQG